MPRPIFAPDSERDILKKIRVAEHALTITPYESVRVAAMKELEKLYNQLREIRNPK